MSDIENMSFEKQASIIIEDQEKVVSKTIDFFISMNNVEASYYKED